MNIFKGKTVVGRLFLLLFLTFAYTVLAYFLLNDYLAGDEYYYVYFGVISGVLALLYSLVCVVMFKTTTKPLREVVGYARTLKNGLGDKKNPKIYADNDVEKINVELNRITDEAQKIRSSNEKFISGSVRSLTKPIDLAREVLEKVINGGRLTSSQVGTVIDELNRAQVKLNLLKEIAMFSTSDYLVGVDTINVITAINDVLGEREQHILKKRLNVEYDFCGNNLFSRIDLISFKQVFGSMIDVCILQLTTGGTFRIVVSGDDNGFSVNVIANACVVSKSQQISLSNDYCLEDIDNVVLLKLIATKRLCARMNMTFIIDTANEDFTVLRVVNGWKINWKLLI